MDDQPDFTISVIHWKIGPKRVEEQYQDLRKKIESEKPDCIIITRIPRHHAKKVAQQDWTKDYFLSKERTEVTERRPVRRGAPISLIYCRYPFTSEEWISPAPQIVETSEIERLVDITHVAEVSIPVGAWKKHCSPLDLLQEYQLKYDEVATFTIIALSETSQLELLKDVFHSVENSVIYVSPDESGDGSQKCVELQLSWWRSLPSLNQKIIQLVSDLTIDPTACSPRN
jgi:hypothetical protein